MRRGVSLFFLLESNNVFLLELAVEEADKSSSRGSSHGSQAERELLGNCGGGGGWEAEEGVPFRRTAASSAVGETAGLDLLASCRILTRICRILMVRSTAMFPVGVYCRSSVVDETDSLVDTGFNVDPGSMADDRYASGSGKRLLPPKASPPSIRQSQ